MYLLDLLIVLSGKIAAVCIALFYLRFLSLPYRLVLLQVLIAMATETAGQYIGRVQHTHNLWLFNYYWLAEYWIMGLAACMLPIHQKVKRVTPYLLAAGTALWAYLIYKNGHDSHPVLALCMICLVLAAIYLSVLFKAMLHNTTVLKVPEFWLSISMILFFACCVPFYSLFNFLYQKNPATLNSLFTIVETLNFIRYPLVAVAIYLHARQRKVFISA